MNFIGLINFSCCLLATYFCYCFLLVVVFSCYCKHCCFKTVSIVTVARQQLLCSGNGFHGDSFMNCLSVSCLVTVTKVTVARQHLNYLHSGKWFP